MENKNLTFEQANELLEKTVSKMESGELTLEQTMEEYAKACELLAYCMKQLEQCKGKIIDMVGANRMNRRCNFYFNE